MTFHSKPILLHKVKPNDICSIGSILHLEIAQSQHSNRGKHRSNDATTDSLGFRRGLSGDVKDVSGNEERTESANQTTRNTIGQIRLLSLRLFERLQVYGLEGHSRVGMRSGDEFTAL